MQAGISWGLSPVRQLIQDQGMTAFWSKTSYCSCWGKVDGVEQNTNSPDPHCKICSSGYIYTEPKKQFPVVFTDLHEAVQWTEEGINPTGNITLIIPDKDVFGNPIDMYLDVGLQDLVVSMDIQLQDIEMVNSSSPLLRRIPAKLVNVSWNGITYVVGDEVTTHLNNLIWQTQRKPPDGSLVSVSYLYYPLYIVLTSLPIAVNYGGLSFPRTILLAERAPITQADIKVFGDLL